MKIPHHKSLKPLPYDRIHIKALYDDDDDDDDDF
jgi:hypothetical protein